MKNRQFITLLLVVVAWFVYLWSRINNMQDYVSTIDKNVATVDERLVWKIIPKLESIEYDIWIIETNVLAIDDWLYEVEKRLGIQ
mgnify:FL=1